MTLFSELGLVFKVVPRFSVLKSLRSPLDDEWDHLCDRMLIVAIREVLTFVGVKVQLPVCEQ